MDGRSTHRKGGQAKQQVRPESVRPGAGFLARKDRSAHIADARFAVTRPASAHGLNPRYIARITRFRWNGPIAAPVRCARRGRRCGRRQPGRGYTESGRSSRARAASHPGSQHVDLTARRERVEAVLDQPANRQQASQRPPRVDHVEVDAGAITATTSSRCSSCPSVKVARSYRASPWPAWTSR